VRSHPVLAASTWCRRAEALRGSSKAVDDKAVPAPTGVVQLSANPVVRIRLWLQSSLWTFACQQAIWTP